MKLYSQFQPSTKFYEKQEMIPMTMEGRLLYFTNQMSKEEQELDEAVNKYIQNGGFTRATGITLVRRNFFISPSEDRIRNYEGFEEYYFSLDSDYQERLKILFKCMNNDILLELDVYSEDSDFSVFLYSEFDEKKIYIDLQYNKSLIDFINAYINGNFRVKVTVDELLHEILKLKNEE